MQVWPNLGMYTWGAHRSSTHIKGAISPLLTEVMN